jgi:prevent-host-death family protein
VRAERWVRGNGARKGRWTGKEPGAAAGTAAPGGTPLPVVGEAPAGLWEAVREGQPVVLTRHGRPVAVAVDLGSWAEVEELLREGCAERGASQFRRRSGVEFAHG